MAKVMLAAAVFGLSAECVVRFVAPQPRVQIVRPGPMLTVYELHGEPVWKQDDSEDRWRTSCRQQHPDARSVLVFGSSIFFGSSVSAERIWTRHLQRRLDERLGSGATCVSNYAQPGYGARNNVAVARDVLPQYPGAVIVWQIWDGDRARFRLFGDTAYAVDRVTTDGDGYPVGFGLSGGLHHWLFRTSRAYEYATLSLVPPMPSANFVYAYRDAVIPQLDQLRELVTRHSARLGLFVVPGLDKPFREQVGEHARYGAKWGGQKAAAMWAEAHSIPRTEVAELLVDEDYREIRLDPCCHYNVRGHEVLARVMLPKILELIASATGK